MLTKALKGQELFSQFKQKANMVCLQLKQIPTWITKYVAAHLISFLLFTLSFEHQLLTI